MPSFLQPAGAVPLWRLLAAASLGWALFMLWGCLNETGSSGGMILGLFPFLRGVEHTDKLVHAGLHAVLAGLLCCAGLARAHATGLRWTAGKALAVVLVCAGYGGAIELLQAGFSTTRSGEWLDALANSAGASLAVLFIQRLRRMQHK
ncbi:VanZ family protein [Comamonas testosteroni]|uniref:VanZ family protein n=1 Tax=Comamonas testosteroni TaxID=285 RepID=UPI002DBBFBAD|nr:VanZ family protein [Comamonas testosteroni]MEB5964825.1 VanZ family protein [Comamonas testosteroni]